VAAGKGGGSWKVAYADFVTAMMAFFLVMWIGAQDQKIRQSVANHFVDPSGVAKKPIQSGAVFDAHTHGGLPKQEAVQNGQGVRTFTPPAEPSPQTRAVADWVLADEKRRNHWRAQAQRCRELVAARNLADQTSTPEELATRELAQLLRAEITAGIPQQPQVYKDLLIGALNDVNWAQVAEHLMAT
jgi:flagellar motor protein MotB